MTTAILQRREVQTTGLPSYARAHLQASISFNPSLLADPSAIPATITITADGLRDPVSPRQRLTVRARHAHNRAIHARQCADRLTAVADAHAARLAALHPVP